MEVAAKPSASFWLTLPGLKPCRCKGADFGHGSPTCAVTEPQNCWSWVGPVEMELEGTSGGQLTSTLSI